MPALTSRHTPPAELGPEARGALRSIVALTEELGADRWGDRRIPLDPRKAPPELAGDAMLCAILGACNSIAGIGCLGRDHTLNDELLERVVPILVTLEQLSDHVLENLEADVGPEAVDAPGWTSCVEILTTIRWAAQVGLLLWPSAPTRLGVAA